MAGDYPDWRSVHADLTARAETLTAAELDTLAECHFWLDDPDEAIAVRGRAYRAHLEADDHEGAALAAWQQFYDHALVGETALADGWLDRARRCTEAAGTPRARGFLHVAEADRRLRDGAIDDAADAAGTAVDIGRTTGDPDLVAMAEQTLGRVHLEAGRYDDGIAAMQSAMVAVVNGELRPLFTGWVFCNALSACHDLADLDRAVQWTEAATKWCAALESGGLYPGLCRLHVVELHGLRGAWATAMSEAEAARDELTAHDPRYAGESHYLIGELHRLRGEFDLAEESYVRAHQLGRTPQPGLARVRLAQGRTDAAVRALATELDPPPASALRTADLLATLVTGLVAAGDVDAGVDRAAELATLADRVDSEFLTGLAAASQAEVALADGDADDAFRWAGDATRAFRRLDMPYERARAQVLRARAAEILGDDDTRILDFDDAREVFHRLGAEPDVRAVDAALGAAATSPLSEREAEVLRHLAAGRTNKEIAAALHLSEHTVARHVANLYTKLGINSRAAATAYAYEHALV